MKGEFTLLLVLGGVHRIRPRIYDETHYEEPRLEVPEGFTSAIESRSQPKSATAPRGLRPGEVEIVINEQSAEILEAQRSALAAKGVRSFLNVFHDGKAVFQIDRVVWLNDPTAPGVYITGSFVSDTFERIFLKNTWKISPVFAVDRSKMPYVAAFNPFCVGDFGCFADANKVAFSEETRIIRHRFIEEEPDTKAEVESEQAEHYQEVMARTDAAIARVDAFLKEYRASKNSQPKAEPILTHDESEDPVTLIHPVGVQAGKRTTNFLRKLFGPFTEAQ
jgi:hypothetical protein